MKKRSDRFLTGVCAVLACSFILSACSAVKDITPIATSNSTFPSALLDTKDLAFTASCENEGPFKWGSDYWTKTTYTLYYNGTIEIKTSYSLSGESVESKDISYTDLKKIRELADKFTANRSKYDLDYSDYYDGVNWYFYTYDTDGRRESVYGGYIIGINELVGITDILDNYKVSETLIERAFNAFEGTYVCADDEDLYISLYKTGDQMFFEIKIADGEDAEIYEITDIELEEEQVLFGYVEDNIWQFFSYSYSVGKTQLQDTETSVTYVRKMLDGTAD